MRVLVDDVENLVNRPRLRRIFSLSIRSTRIVVVVSPPRSKRKVPHFERDIVVAFARFPLNNQWILGKSDTKLFLWKRVIKIFVQQSHNHTHNQDSKVTLVGNFEVATATRKHIEKENPK